MQRLCDQPVMTSSTGRLKTDILFIIKFPFYDIIDHTICRCFWSNDFVVMQSYVTCLFTFFLVTMKGGVFGSDLFASFGLFSSN